MISPPAMFATTPTPTTHAWIRLRDLSIDNASVGALPHERTQRQEIRIDVAVLVPVAAAAQSDSLRDTVDYSKMAEVIRHTALARHFVLIESLADTLANRILSTFARVERVCLEVHKPGALQTTAVSIAVERTR